MTEDQRGVEISVRAEGWEAVEDGYTQEYTLYSSKASVVLPSKRNHSMYLRPAWGLLTGSTLREGSYLNRRGAMI
jgi:hypothetical protein